jgi:hypothetical protein
VWDHSWGGGDHDLALEEKLPQMPLDRIWDLLSGEGHRGYISRSWDLGISGQQSYFSWAGSCHSPVVWSRVGGRLCLAK